MWRKFNKTELLPGTRKAANVGRVTTGPPPVRRVYELSSLPVDLEVTQPLSPAGLLRLATEDRGHSGCVHNAKILIAVVEDRVRAPDALLLQIAESFG